MYVYNKYNLYFYPHDLYTYTYTYAFVFKIKTNFPSTFYKTKIVTDIFLTFSKCFIANTYVVDMFNQIF